MVYGERFVLVPARRCRIVHATLVMRFPKGGLVFGIWQSIFDIQYLHPETWQFVTVYFYQGLAAVCRPREIACKEMRRSWVYSCELQQTVTQASPALLYMTYHGRLTARQSYFRAF